MVSHRERTGKDGTRLAVFALAVAEEKRVGSGISMTKHTSLAHKASTDHSSTIDMRPGRDNEIIGNHIMSDIDRGVLITVYRTIV